VVIASLRKPDISYLQILLVSVSTQLQVTERNASVQLMSCTKMYCIIVVFFFFRFITVGFITGLSATFICRVRNRTGNN